MGSGTGYVSLQVHVVQLNKRLFWVFFTIHEDETSTKKKSCQVYETSYVLISQTMYLVAEAIPALVRKQ